MLSLSLDPSGAQALAEERSQIDKDRDELNKQVCGCTRTHVHTLATRSVRLQDVPACIYADTLLGEALPEATCCLQSLMPIFCCDTTTLLCRCS